MKHHHLKSGFVQSCGCWNREATLARLRSGVMHRHFDRRTKHPLYRTFNSMHMRCENKNNAAFKFYGGRGIRVCARWSGKDGFKHFLADMGNKPDPSLTLDRKDTNGGYSPENCRWATRSTQQNNMRSNTKYTWLGETLSLSQWAHKTGIRRNILEHRISRGMSLDEAFTLQPRRGQRFFCQKGHRLTLETTIEFYGKRLCRLCQEARNAA